MILMSFKDSLRRFMVLTKRGYDSTYWIFVLIGAAAVLTKLFGMAGIAAVVVVFLFFYLAGRMHLRLEPTLTEEENRLRNELHGKKAKKS
jgi:fatty acid desaturase